MKLYRITTAALNELNDRLSNGHGIQCKFCVWFWHAHLVFERVFIRTGAGWTRRLCTHNGVIKWKHFPRYWPFVWGIHRSPVNSPHKGQWRRALMFSLICAWINGWVNNSEAGDVRRHCTHYVVIVMKSLAMIDEDNLSNIDSISPKASFH